MLKDDRFDSSHYIELKNDLWAVFEDTDVTYTEAETALKSILSLVRIKREKEIERRCRLSTIYIKDRALKKTKTDVTLSYDR